MQNDVRLIVGTAKSDNIANIMVFHQVMISASSVFAAMLDKYKFNEGHELRRQGKVDIPLPDDDPKAMGLVCDIIHMRTPEALHSVDPELLWEVATLIDKYDFAQAIQPWPAFWAAQQQIQKIWEKGHDLPLHEVARWVHICCNLGFAIHFNKSTSILVQSANDGDLEEEAFMRYWKVISPAVRGEY